MPRRRAAPLVAVGMLMGVGALVAPALAGVTARVAGSAHPAASLETLSGGVAAGRNASVSGDGRWVVYEGDGDGRTTVLRTDRTTGLTTELTPVPDGVRPGDTVNPVLSADGCVVVVQTELALDLFRDDDTGDRWDVYRTVMPECGGSSGRWELVSSDGASGTARDDVDVDAPASVNESGALVAFSHPMAGRRADVTTISVVDLTVPLGDPGRTTELPAMPVEAPTSVYRYRGANAPALSADGRHLAFTSDATSADPLPGWSDGATPGDWATLQVYVWDRHDDDRVGRVQLVSGRAGVPAPGGATAPAISADGRVIAFVSTDQSLVDATYPPCDAACPSQVYRVDRDPGGTGELGADPDASTPTLVSAVTDAHGAGVAGDAPSWAPALNVDGSQVAFVSRAANLFASSVGAGQGEGDGDIVVAEVPLGELRRATDMPDRGPLVAAHARPALSATGRVLVFDTAAPDAVDVDAAGGRAVVSMVTEPTLSLAVLDFGTVHTGWDSDELHVSVLNEGPGAFAPADVTSTSPNFRVTDGGTCTRGLVVPAGGTCTVHVTFNPSQPSDFTGTLHVSEEVPVRAPVPVDPADPADPADPGADGAAHDPADEGADEGAGSVATPSDALTVSTQLTGHGGEPVLRVEPASIDLGDAVVGAAGARRAFDIRNVSEGPTEVAAVTVAGAHPDDFVVTAESCTGRALNRNATCTVEVEFAPTGASRRTASIRAATASAGYAAGVVVGGGRFEPVLVLAEPAVVAGSELGIGLAGFPPGAQVVLTFGDTGYDLATLRTDAGGGLLALVDVPRRERGGERELVARGPGGVVATATVRVDWHDPAAPGLPGYGLG